MRNHITILRCIQQRMKESGRLELLHELQNEVANHGTKKELCTHVGTWLMDIDQARSEDVQLRELTEEFLAFCQSNAIFPAPSHY